MQVVNCSNYWPDAGRRQMEFGAITVQNIDEKIFDDIDGLIKRTFNEFNETSLVVVSIHQRCSCVADHLSEQIR
jgi:hypothetical protein